MHRKEWWLNWGGPGIVAVIAIAVAIVNQQHHANNNPSGGGSAQYESKSVNTTNLNLRSEPNAKASRIATLPRGTRVHVIQSFQNGWDHIIVDVMGDTGQSPPNRLSGYVNDALLGAVMGDVRPVSPTRSPPPTQANPAPPPLLPATHPAPIATHPAPTQGASPSELSANEVRSAIIAYWDTQREEDIERAKWEVQQERSTHTLIFIEDEKRWYDFVQQAISQPSGRDRANGLNFCISRPENYEGNVVVYVHMRWHRRIFRG